MQLAAMLASLQPHQVTAAANIPASFAHPWLRVACCPAAAGEAVEATKQAAAQAAHVAADTAAKVSPF